MPNESSIHELMTRLRDGDEAAAAQVFNRFANDLIVLARSRLDRLLLRKVDPEDVLQSVFHSFFARTNDGQFDIQSWDSLWGLLTTITLRKCGRQGEYFRAARRDLRREVTAAASPNDSLPPLALEITSPSPTPEEAAVLAETLEELLGRLDGRSRPIVSLRLQGYTTAEVSTQVGCTERTVQRVLEQVRKWLQHRQDDTSDPANSASRERQRPEGRDEPEA
jgi:RNA polymerase sigma-70 factor (ECF subfamily)